MFKSNLQELCQKRSWSLPTYSTTKQGLHHSPSFSATVFVNNLSFHTLTLFKSSKEAQNDAARLAFQHLSRASSIPSSSSFPQPSLLSSGSSVATTRIDTTHIREETFPHSTEEKHKIPEAISCSFRSNLQINGVQENKKFRDVHRLYKNELQTYAQKRNIVLPVYSCEREGPPRASRFKCKVAIDGKTYESAESFSTVKEAEHAAAKVALTSLSPEGVESDDSAFYKNLLQELAQKVGFHLPVYDTNRFGGDHTPVFISTVEIEGECFSGEKAKTKKQAETSAARVAYNSLRERQSSQISLISPPSLHEQKETELLPSSSQSNISATLQQHGGPSAPMILKPSAPTISHAESMTGKGGSASSNILNSSTQEILPCESHSEGKPDSNSISTTNCSKNSDVGSYSREALCNSVDISYKKITVYPANKPIPESSTLLPFRDENWVAFCSPEAR